MYRTTRRKISRTATAACALALAAVSLAALAVPPKPADFRHEVYSRTAAEIFWDRVDDPDGILGYEVTRNGETLGVLDALSVFDDTLAEGIDYTYTVRAVDRRGDRSAIATLVLRTPKSADTIAALERRIEALRERLESDIVAPLPRTGQTTSLAPGDDGDRQAGVVLPDPRFTLGVAPGEDADGDGVCGGGERCDGTVTDRSTGLTWLRDANCFGASGWSEALDRAAALADDGSGRCELNDASRAGDWRLPSIRELFSVLDFSRSPVLPAGHPFANLPAEFAPGTEFLPDTEIVYWTGTSRTGWDGTYAPGRESAYAVTVIPFGGEVQHYGPAAELLTWPVR